ncbi:MAG: DUF2961 domain-containing protein [Abditibacteriota bacterium]|nr:DUF2961 domain-containing protein [Abditibacteriota bacterium]
MNLFDIPENVETRWASCENPHGLKGEGGKERRGRKGSAYKRVMVPGEVLTLAHAENTRGIIRRMWMTFRNKDKTGLLGFVLRMYWDGCEKPAVEAPLGDFFCQPWGVPARFQNAWFDNSEGRSFVCRIPMPFRKGFKITVTNESDIDQPLFFYDVNLTVNDDIPENAGYFHCHYRREHRTTPKRDFEILPKTLGEGRFLGCALGAIANQAEYAQMWWGEGEVKMYIDGDTDYPTLCGTGTEDYIATAWGQGQFDCMWHGCPLADHINMKYGFYRLHGPDPVYFHKDIRVTIQQIGNPSRDFIDLYLRETGKVFERAGYDGDVTSADTEDNFKYYFERSDDWCATAYYYLNSPVDDMPEIIPYEERIYGLANSKVL